MRRIRDLIPRGEADRCHPGDPVERVISTRAHLWSAGLEPIGDFVRACAQEQHRIEAGWASFWHYTGLGKYGEQPGYAYTLFPREHVLILLTGCWSNGPPWRWTGSAPSSGSSPA